MVARPEELLERVSSRDAETRLRAVRSVKNQVVGSRARKLSYLKLGAVPLLVRCLEADQTESGLLIQCAATVSSLTYDVEDGARAVLASGAVAHLVSTLASPDPRVVEAGVRSLKMICRVCALGTLYP